MPTRVINQSCCALFEFLSNPFLVSEGDTPKNGEKATGRNATGAVVAKPVGMIFSRTNHRLSFNSPCSFRSSLEYCFRSAEEKGFLGSHVDYIPRWAFSLFVLQRVCGVYLQMRKLYCYESVMCTSLRDSGVCMQRASCLHCSIVAAAQQNE
jgi:hypothetical protein